MSLNGGDVLARGGKTASFSAGGNGLSQKEWDRIFLSDEKFLDAYGQTKDEFLAESGRKDAE